MTASMSVSWSTRLFIRCGSVLPGLALCTAIAALSTALGAAVPLVGSAIPAVLIGVVVAVWRAPHARFGAGIGVSSKFILQCGVVLLGGQLTLDVIATVGVYSLPVMLSSLVVCLCGAHLIGHALRIRRELRILLGVGTGICGASAIAAVSPVIRAKSENVSYAISTVFVFNILAVLSFPFFGHALGMNDHSFGLFAGTAVNDTSSVVASASVFSASALGFAVVVKLVRTLMIIPLSVGLSILEARRNGEVGTLTPGRAVRLVPWFLVGFVALATARSVGVLPDELVSALSHVSVFCIAMALAGIGLSTNLGELRATGLRPLLLGGILSLLVAVTTLAAMLFTGQLPAG